MFLKILKEKLFNEAGTDGDSAGGAAGNPGGGTVISSGGDPAGSGDPAPAPAWPNDWRNQWAGSDEKKLNYISRYTDPLAALNAGWNANNAIRSGEYKKLSPFPEKGTPEQQAAWRKDNGLPEAPDKYDLTFDNGIVIGDEDKPFVDDFLKSAFGKNMPNQTVKDVLGWWYENKEAQAQAQADKDLEIKNATITKLMEDWGANYKENVARTEAFVGMMPAELQKVLAGARLSDGTPFLSHADTIKWMAGLALEQNPAVTLVPNTGGDIQSNVQSEIDRLTGMMGDRNSAYWKGPEAEKNQARFRQLQTAMEQMKRKAG